MAQAAHQARHGFAHHLRTHWPAILFVPALVTILHHWSFLDAVDGYSYLVIGNLSALVLPELEGAASRPRRQSGAVVALIDQHTFETQHRERSPLDRCALREHLTAIYGANPHRVVIDLDLSPAPLLDTVGATAEWKAPDCGKQAEVEKAPDANAEHRCQDELYCLITSNAKSVDTTLMVPFRSLQLDVLRRQLCWQAWMQESQVRFGRAELPVTYGLVIKQFDDARALTAVARNFGKSEEAGKMRCPQRQEGERAIREAVDKPLTSHAAKLKLIDPRRYTADIRVVEVHPSPENANPASFRDRVKEALDMFSRNSNYPDRAVFFGAGFGEYDVYLTPIDEAYGVEIHAAAYLTEFEPVTELHTVGRKLIQFLGDVLLALGFSLAISWFWAGYFAARLSPDAGRDQMAQLYVIGLFVGFLFVVALLCLISLGLLHMAGLWLSPIPIALGMLIDSFLVGSVQEVAGHYSKRRNILTRELSGRYSENEASEVAHRVFGQERREFETMRQSIWSFFLDDFRRYRSDGRTIALVLLAARRFGWAVVVGLGLFAVFAPH
jgi:CHASE2 domain